MPDSKKQVEKLKEEIKVLKEKRKTDILREKLKAFRSKTKTQTITLVTSAFGFVSALFWRDAIKALIQQTIQVSPGEGWWVMQTVVALIVTVIAVVAVFLISHLESK